MNPRIHHPLWYEYIGVLNHEQMEAATRAPDTVCLQPMAQFKTDQFQIVCDESKWAIRTEKPDASERIQAISSRVFAVLEHTPTSSFGLNFNFQRKTALSDVPARLFSMLRELHSVLVAPGVGSARIVLKRDSPDRSVTVTIASSEKSTDMVSVSNNFHYQITADTFELFDLGARIGAAFPRDLSEAIAHANNMVDLLNRSARE